jgi:hypothetical protein
LRQEIADRRPIMQCRAQFSELAVHPLKLWLKARPIRWRQKVQLNLQRHEIRRRSDRQRPAFLVKYEFGGKCEKVSVQSLRAVGSGIQETNTDEQIISVIVTLKLTLRSKQFFDISV